MTTLPITPNLSAVVPLAALVLAALGILLIAPWKAPWQFSAWVALACTVVTPALTLIVLFSSQVGALQGMLDLDGGSAAFILFACGAGAAAILIDLGSLGHEQGGRYALILLALAGATVVAQSIHLVAMVIGLALLGITLAALLGPRAAWHYWIVHGTGLAAVLLSISILYAAAGGLRIDLLTERANRLAATGPQPLLVLGATLLVIGLGWAIGTFPFDGWLRGVYRFARHSGGLLLALLLPGTAIAALLRLNPVWSNVHLLLAWLGALGAAYAYTRALRATSLRGLLSGVSVAQSGLLMYGLATGPVAGRGPLLFALGNAGLNMVCLWAWLVNVRRRDRWLATPADVAGLGRRRPWLAGAVTLGLLNLAGLPPLAGAISQISLARAAAAAGYVGPLIVQAFSCLAAWLLAGRWLWQIWLQPAERRLWVPSTPEIAALILAAAGVMLAAGLYAGPILQQIANLSAAP